MAANCLSPGSELCFDETHPGPPYLTGGNFLVQKNRYSGHSEPLGPMVIRNTTLSDEQAMFWTTYTGHFRCYNPVDFVGSNLTGYTPLYLSEYGPKAWGRFAPSRPTADLSVFVAELRELPKMLKQTADAFKRRSWKQGRRAKAGASNWLNYQFGWLPFVNDLRKFLRTIINIDKQIKFLEKNNGKWLHRGGDVLNASSTDVVLENNTFSYMFPTLDSSFYVSGDSGCYGSSVITRSIVEHVWFEAKMKFYIPSISYGPLPNLSRIFGARLTPEVVWELTPWSWLVDWVCNVGDNLTNLSLILDNNVVAAYAFLMGRRTEVISVSCQQPFKVGTLSHTWHFSRESKERSKASPFGFGLSSDNFTARQFSILGALGISKFT